MTKLTQFKAPGATTPQRLDVWLAGKLPESSRSFVRRQIDQGLVLLNNRRVPAKTLVYAGDTVTLLSENEQGPGGSPETGRHGTFPPIPVLYEDEDLLVINKPAGIAVHPGGESRALTVVDWLLAHCPALAKIRGSFPESERPGIVHRLDKDTSGSLVLAKTLEVYQHLGEQFRHKSNLRQYLALLDGVPPWFDHKISSYLGRNPRKRQQFASYSAQEAQELHKRAGGGSLRLAESLFVRERMFGHRLVLARVTLSSGRTHQIRVHSKALGFPIWGDPLYNHPKALPQIFAPDLRRMLEGISRQLLHAERLSLVHPRSKELLDFRAELPADFAAVLAGLEKYEIL